ncbi:MAG: hypothetical protein COX34_00060 [Candidatus Nealsonbacteria bacterium CG23_combo_of_CG06-09_8_20_14_all_36_12]|uniref:C2H2-type domain-containing protein n=2 Tax=Candidatus Nealsoniibacteriota TaxID=1817911 RepID=A0A2H0TNC4_9BACT|nr:MAG: hypothetical protein COX34_00060 [Candidatus Nealsonbacteria bacterium CG23_combo_of_CG06-09_8_20_14_all_36_12]PIR72917.1 MAG: hypothetical protein COV26_01290 [Candidatus Nealsonbacteria bacterium CG10_big_fil_rev_8_21_14_0_10_36_23]
MNNLRWICRHCHQGFGTSQELMTHINREHLALAQQPLVIDTMAKNIAEHMKNQASRPSEERKL